MKIVKGEMDYNGSVNFLNTFPLMQKVLVAITFKAMWKRLPRCWQYIEYVLRKCLLF